MNEDKSICIMCGKTREELGGLSYFHRFKVKNCLLCVLCFIEMVENQVFGELPTINIETIRYVEYKKEKISKKVRKTVYERDDYKCVYCGSDKNLTLDHVIPESKGGESTVENLVVACRKCNTKKGTEYNRKKQEVV